MKKIILSILFIGFGIFALCHYLNYATLKSSWHVTIKNSYINVRESASSQSKKITQVKSGKSFRVLEAKSTPSYIWYKIKTDKGEGWVANPKDGSYLDDHNDPNDYTPPTLKYYDEIYHTYSMDTINYDDLDISDDKPNYKVEHVVYADSTDPLLYWIIYTVTDQGGNKVSKTRQIDFTIQPAQGSLQNIQDR